MVRNFGIKDLLITKLITITCLNLIHTEIGLSQSSICPVSVGSIQSVGGNCCDSFIFQEGNGTIRYRAFSSNPGTDAKLISNTWVVNLTETVNLGSSGNSRIFDLNNDTILFAFDIYSADLTLLKFLATTGEQIGNTYALPGLNGVTKYAYDNDSKLLLASNASGIHCYNPWTSELLWSTNLSNIPSGAQNYSNDPIDFCNDSGNAYFSIQTASSEYEIIRVNAESGEFINSTSTNHPRIALSDNNPESGFLMNFGRFPDIQQFTKDLTLLNTIDFTADFYSGTGASTNFSTGVHFVEINDSFIVALLNPSTISSPLGVDSYPYGTVVVFEVDINTATIVDVCSISTPLLDLTSDFLRRASFESAGLSTGDGSGWIISPTVNVYGCIDPAACNFNESANVDNSSCEYAMQMELEETIYSCLDSVYAEGPDGFTYYEWSNGSTSQGTWLSDTGAYTLTAWNLDYCVSLDTLYVELYNNPASLSINGPTLTNITSIESYSIEYETVETNWTVSGGQIIAGQNTNSVNVLWQSEGTHSLCAQILSPQDCGTEFNCIIVDVTTDVGVPSPYDNTELFAYPNPSHGILTLETRISAPSCCIRIIDVTGKEIDRFHMESASMQVDLSDLDAGLYFVRMNLPDSSEDTIIINILN